MSAELKCHFLIYGASLEVADFLDKFAAKGFEGHVPIPADAEPKIPCEPIYRNRRLAEERWGTRFIYPRPGIEIHRGVSPVIERELREIAAEHYEGNLPPQSNDAVALITCTVPTDPPALWADRAIRDCYEQGQRLVIRWWDMENYHRCMECGALDGICLRSGAFWSTEDGDHVAVWHGVSRCSCSGQPLGRADQRSDYGAETRRADDDEVVSMTAFADGSAIRVISTFRNGWRGLLRFRTTAGETERVIRDINSINHVIRPELVEEPYGANEAR